MARSLFGVASPDWVVTKRLNGAIYVASGVQGTFWDAKVGGTQHDDLLIGTDPTSSVTATDGQYQVYGPDDVTWMWADFGGERELVVAWPELLAQILDAADDVAGALETILAFGNTQNAMVAGFVTGAGATKDALSAATATQLATGVPPLVTAALAADGAPASAAAAAVASALASGGVLTAATAPALDTNRAVDPQQKTVGFVTDVTSYTFNRLTGGINLPAGFTYGLESVRKGTLNSVISDLRLGDKTSSLPTPVIPGETITAALMTYCDQGAPTTNAFAGVEWYNSAGTLLSTSWHPVAFSVPASTWTQLVLQSMVVPASAARAVIRIYHQTLSGNTVTGAIHRVTGAIIHSGTVAAPTYGDGSFSGWAWSGAAHASASVKVLYSTAELNALADARAAAALTAVGSPMSLVKTGVNLVVSSALGASTLATDLVTNGSSNGTLNIGATRLDGTQINVGGDEVAPLRVSPMGAVGGNHGYPNVSTFTNPDGKTTADLGSEWQDTAGRRYVLLAIVGGLLVMGGDYTTSGGVASSAAVAPATNLTHVSGATHTGAIAFGTKVASQLYPSMKNSAVTVLVDGKPITADGTYQGREVTVRAVAEILDYGSLYDTAKANVGTSFATLLGSILSVIRVVTVYRFRPNGVCKVSQELTELRPVTLGAVGGVQNFPMTKSGSVRKRYVPGVGTVSGTDWTAGLDLDGTLPAPDFTPANAPDGAPFYFDVLTVSGTPFIGWACGYYPYGIRGDENSRTSTRLAAAAPTGLLMQSSSTGKGYPYYISNNGKAAGWGRITMEAFRTYLTSAESSALLAAKATSLAAWAALDNAKSLS